MEKNSLAVLEYIVANAREGQATVFSAEELTAALPDDGAEGVSVIPVVKELALNNLIRLKYSDGRNVCVEPLEKGILIVEKEQKRGLSAAIEDKSRSIKGIVTLSLMCGFAGGCVAVALAVAIYFIVRAIAL